MREIKTKEDVYWEKTIRLVMKGNDGDREEYWDEIELPNGQKQSKYVIAQMQTVLRFAIPVADTERCGVCRTKLCDTVCTAGANGRGCRSYICSTCSYVINNAVTTDTENPRIKTMDRQMASIYNLRKHQKSIIAVLTLLNHRSQHRLPNDLIRTLKGYLY